MALGQGKAMVAKGVVLRAAASACIPLALSLGVAMAEGPEDGKAEVVLRNGKIYTADPSRSIRQALAFTGNTIVAVGDDADVAPLIGAKTKVIDLGGKLVLPGLIDTHIHPIIGAVNGAKCSLAGVKAAIEALKPVIQSLSRRGCRAVPTSGSRRPSSTITASRRRPKTSTGSRRHRPIALWGNDGHTAWVNSRGLELLGVTAETPDPPGGKIGRDGSGRADGLFRRQCRDLRGRQDSGAVGRGDGGADRGRAEEACRPTASRR